ncbi:porin family protein [Flavobacterium sp. N1736]|uniref:porin family protein n=1 Tax=Flavobacterium sp. N1736 TaxID=2986823 RepID=UPI00222513B2|nr:porin family protein [Flavobacterium sp. N1736]
MKKIMLTAAAVLAFAFSNAQETKFGVKAGLNISNIGGDVEDNSAIVGFHVGGFAEIKLSEKFAIQPELLFSTQGSKIEDSGENFSAEDKLNLSYINVPIMAKFYVAPKFSLEAGPQIGFLVSAKDKYKETFDGETISSNEDVKDNFKSIDFGVNLGAGFDFTENLSAGVRYNIGLSNIAEAEGEDFKLNNSVFSLSVGYKF